MLKGLLKTCWNVETLTRLKSIAYNDVEKYVENVENVENSHSEKGKLIKLSSAIAPHSKRLRVPE